MNAHLNRHVDLRPLLLLFGSLFALAVPAPAQGPPQWDRTTDALWLKRTPYLQDGTPTSVVVRWDTFVKTNSVLRWGTDPSQLAHQVSSPLRVKAHELEIVGLSPDTRYYYSVGNQLTTFAGGDHNHTFLTFPLAGSVKPTRIWVLGDCGTADGNAEAVRDAYYNYTAGVHTDLWLMLGDNAYLKGRPAEYQKAVFEMYPTMLRKSVLFSTRGNHETQESVYYGQFTFPTMGEGGGLPSGSEAYYSFDYANVHFVCLDSLATDTDPGSPMLTWLAADLGATNQDWIVAYWHHPPYTKGNHDSDDILDSNGRMFAMREDVLPTLESYGVDLVLCGHSHSYERSFLIDGHYGVSSTFDPATMLIDGGDGREFGSGVYSKTTGPNEGAVFTVAGCSGKVTSGGTYNHPVMYYGNNELGSLVLDVSALRLDVSFLRSDGVVADWFTITTQ